MRVWAFPSFYPYDRPGFVNTGIFAHRQYKGLIANGAEVRVVVPVKWKPIFPISLMHSDWREAQTIGYPRQRIYDGITVYHPYIANMKPSRFVKKSYADRYVAAIVKFFKNEKIVLNPANDIFYSQWLPDCALVQQAAHLLGIKSAILSIGDDVIVWPGGSNANLLAFKQLLTAADLRFACADYLGKEANKLMGQNLPYEVVNWGVDHTFFKPGNRADKDATKKEYNIPADKIVILTIGSPIKRKGWLDLFDALNKVKEVRNDFVLVGIHSGLPEFDLSEEAANRGLAANFIDLGEVDPKFLDKLYNAADIFCLPSHWEGLANVVIEAMSSGLPVITTDVCGHPEVITSGNNGILVPPKEPDILAEALLVLIADNNKRKYLGDNARNFIVTKWGNFVDSAKKLYERLSGSLSVK